MAGPIHIALTFDDAYWAPAYAVMRSVALASRRREDLVFHMIHSGLGPAHAAVLASIADEFPVAIRPIRLDEHAAYRAFIDRLHIGPPFTPVIYARLLLAALLPAEIDRVIYLDSDVYVRGRIEELAGHDLAGRPVGAVLDPHRHRAMLGRDFRQNRDLFAFHYRYFNSGVLLIDRAAYGAADLPGRTRAYHEAGVLGRVQYDQAVLNLVFKDNWQPLDFRWNLTCPSPAHEALEPHLLHYTGPAKPWALLSRAAFAQAYRHTMTNAVFYAFWRERWRRRLTAPFRRLAGGRR